MRSSRSSPFCMRSSRSILLAFGQSAKACTKCDFSLNVERFEAEPPGVAIPRRARQPVTVRLRQVQFMIDERCDRNSRSRPRLRHDPIRQGKHGREFAGGEKLWLRTDRQAPRDHISCLVVPREALSLRQYVVAWEAGTNFGVRHRDDPSLIPMQPDPREQVPRSLGARGGEGRSGRSGSSCANHPCCGTRRRHEGRSLRPPSL